MVSNWLFAAPFGMVDVFVFGGRDVAEIAVKALRIEPVNPSQGGELQICDRAPGSLFGSVDQFGLVETVHAFRQRVIETGSP